MKTVTKYCKWLKILLAGIFFLVPAFPVSAAPGEYQQCTNTADCIVGEFLFNDEYVPVADADCTLTARYPDGTVFINSATLPPSADGWYSYDIGTSGQPLGLYRSQICCTTIDGYMCLDKSFTITQDTAESVWSYDNRTISSFGNIVQEIWTLWLVISGDTPPKPSLLQLSTTVPPLPPPTPSIPSAPVFPISLFSLPQFKMISSPSIPKSILSKLQSPPFRPTPTIF
ncbi:MAG: hypothetical protein UT14_C0051G0007 [Candidatus Shapirobacteria bacterium GW2011_GWE1_38_92]|uniref:Uncharacterized protein n=1 Tax=Candidatus Shapirobacteria bacterium GW2011_GWE1_38_92 TaxID=1618489 RepID=A0A0G0LPA1_9BACT|nr:MAG: hypothetical protein UT14_C0051G0007 [Candidatus Shapirobacteria bacterium GW2011_GWE1_38_92]